MGFGGFPERINVNCIEPKVRGTPDNRGFCVIGGAKIHKRDRLLACKSCGFSG
jgi:hypothetical protein